MNFVRRTHDTPRIHIYIFFIYANLILRSYTSTIAAAAASARLIRFFFLPYFSSFASVQELNYQLFTFEASRMRQDSALRWCQFLWTQSLSLSFKREREKESSGTNKFVTLLWVSFCVFFVDFFCLARSVRCIYSCIFFGGEHGSSL